MEAPPTLARHVARQAPALAVLFGDLERACQRIAGLVRAASLAGVTGDTGCRSHQGDAVKKLDLAANEILVEALGGGGAVCSLASEEEQQPIPLPDGAPRGEHAVLFDPLDGSSNIDANVSTGTIFSVYRTTGAGELADLLQPGRAQVAAGYCLYGPATMFVYTTGESADGFTLDPRSGEFLLTHPAIRTPPRSKVYSVNEANEATWDAATRRYVAGLKERCSARYIGSLVADFHRNLLYGGIFLYPDDCRDPQHPRSKLRLLYEGNPLALVCEAAGGAASTGRGRVLDVEPHELHQRVQLVLGSAEDVAEFEQRTQ